MPRYLVEVTQPQRIAAKRIGQAVSSIGSHFATHAHWRNHAGVSTGAMVVEADDRWRAIGIVPPGMRSGARIFELSPMAAATLPAPTGSRNEAYAVAA